MRRKNRLTTDAVREIRFTFSRFCSILVLSALAVAFLAGLRTTAPDMEYTADRYYDRTHLMDGYVISTLGLTQEDLDALVQAPGVTAVEGGKSLEATVQDAIVSVRSLPERLNLLEVAQGRLPQAADECVTESLLMVELGLEVGDTLELSVNGEGAGGLRATRYTVVGVVNSPLYVGSDRDSSSLGGSVDGFVYLPGENFTQDYYTEGYFLLEGLAELNSYAQDYEDRLETYLDGLEGLAQERAQLRAEELTTQAQGEIDEGQAQLDEARQALDEGRAELAAAGRELEEGWAAYEEGLAALERESAQGRRELEAARQDLEAGQGDLAAGREQYQAGLAQYQQALAEYEQNRDQLDGQQAQVTQGYAQYEAALEPYVGTPYYEVILEQLAPQKAQLDAAQAQADIDQGEAELEQARQELADLGEGQWYVLGRNTNAGVVGYAQDAQRVSNLANVFPVIFFLVAALACLTTMTRMVEDQRTQIGALKALGFSRLAISKKYIGYAFWASLLGGGIGLAVGCTLIPMVIANAFQILYNVPPLEFAFQPVVCVVAVLAAVACTTGAALWACLSTLMDTPANLMRPKAPKPGRRVFLEYIRPLWRSLSFTWKVTMRNLFRYQRRFWMTVAGIGGCTALIVTGFGLHESIFDILDKQFDEIFRYDATASLAQTDQEGQVEQVLDYLDQAPEVAGWLLCHESTVELSAGGQAQSGYLLAVEDPAGMEPFIQLRHRLDDEPVRLGEEGVILTEKLAELLEVSPGETVTLERDGDRAQAVVTDVVENYVYHYAYLTAASYEALFGQAPEENTVLVAYEEGVDQAASDGVSAHLMAMEGVAAYSYIATIRDSFTNSMNAINYAVVIIILAAAALAFVVLYNLTNINITERTRELATLKVLGFYDRETTAYVYRENLFLTLFGIALGLGLGRVLHAWMVVTVEIDLVMFGRTAPLYAYVLAGLLTVVFSAAVNVAAHFRLKRVDMVESLKTVE
ncbi:MAG TPA: FtsX-like permease family protein [Firmicutes bacterium]|nr:FtsX-like permease family protein [Bacillota bacterium]